MIKQKNGYSLGVLVITIAVMLILTTTVLMSFRSMSEDRDITNFMNDITEVSEYVKEYYGEKNILPIKYDRNNNPIEITVAEHEKIRPQADENDAGNYYYIDLAKLERIHLKDEERDYIVNEKSLKIYVLKPITFEGLDYYTITDEMKGLDKTYNSSGDFEVLISGNPINWASKGKLILSVPTLTLEDNLAGSGWTFKYYTDGPITADEFKDKGRLFLYGETVEIKENGIVSFYAENDEGYAKVVNVVVSMIDETNPTITLNGDRTTNGELVIVDNETGINPDKLLYKIIGYDNDLEAEINGRDVLFYGTRYAKYIEKYNALKASYDDIGNKISDLKALGSGDDELSNLYTRQSNIQVEINELNNENRDFNDGIAPYEDDVANIAIYVQDYAGNKDSYIMGVSRNVLLNSNLIDYEAKPLENSAFSIVKTGKYTKEDNIYLRIRAQGATHMLITLDSSIDQTDLSNYTSYESSNGEYEINIKDINSEKIIVYAYFTAGEYENGNLIYNSFADYVLVDKEEPTTDAPNLEISNELELKIIVEQKDLESGIGKIEYGYQLANKEEDTTSYTSYTWVKNVKDIENIVEAGKRYYIRTRVSDEAGNGPVVSERAILNCPEEKISAEPNAPKIGSMQAITWNSNLEEIEINSETFKDANGTRRVWYDYAVGNGVDDLGISKWANAKADDGSYFVWIPRYAYRIIYYTDVTKTEINGYYQKSPFTGTIGYFLEDGETASTEAKVKTLYGNIDIVFLYNAENDKYQDKETGHIVSLIEGGTKKHSKYIVHPAFITAGVGTNTLGTWGDSSLTGIWVSKFEASRLDANYTSDGTSEAVKIVPSVKGVNNITVSKAYDYATSFNSTMNPHLMKNSEWGAVAYLAYSAYGRNGHAIEQNLSSDRITGSGTTPGGANYATPNQEDYERKYGYKTTASFKSNTTNNIYGIYDLAGGVAEFVASYVNNGELNSTNTSSLLNATIKYSQLYNEGTADTSNGNYAANSGVYGDAIYEISTSETALWKDNTMNYPYGNEAIFVRGGSYSNETGMFEVNRSSGAASPEIGFRIILAQ